MDISSVGGTNQAGYAPVQKKDVGQHVSTTGAGITAQAGAAPDPASPGYQMIVSSLAEFFPALTGEQIDIKIAEATLKLQEIVGKTNTNELIAKEEQKRESLAERTNNLKEAERKMEEAEAKQKKSGFLDRLKTAFQAIGAIITMAIGAALIATGVGGPMGAALIALGGLQLLMMIDSVIAQHNDGVGIGGMIAGGIAQNLADLGFNISDEQIEKAENVGNIAFQVVLTVAIIAGAIMTARADVAAAQFAQGAAIVTSAVTTATTSSLAIGSSVVNKQATDTQADAQDIQAKGQDLQAFNEILNDFIDQILNRISGSNTQINAMLDDISQTVKDRGDTLARASFTA